MSFQFVIHDGPKITKDPAVRTLIRKQAMKDVALARKKRGNHIRVKVRQRSARDDYDHDSDVVEAGDATGTSKDSLSCTASSASDELVLSSTRPMFAKLREQWNGEVMSNNHLPNIVLQTNYESVRSKYGVDLLDLSLLASFGIGRETAQTISTNPGRLHELLGRDFWTYLEHVPRRYGQHACVTDAVNCVLARASTLLMPGASDTSPAQCRVLYGKALQSVQKAISDDVHSTDADVLCATQLLSLHEILDSDRDSAWSHHVYGTARLIRHRTPARFQTEYEKALLACHVGSIVSESLIRDEACFLETPDWMNLYRSFSKEGPVLDDRSALCIDGQAAMIPLPGLWTECTNTINSDALFSFTGLLDLETRCRDMHSLMLDWMDDYKLHCVRTSLSVPTARELGLRRELFGMTVQCLCLLKRLIATLCDADRIALETEGQALAHLLIDLQKQKTPLHVWLYQSHELGVAYTTIATKEQWEEDVSDRSFEEQKLATRARYNTWSSSLRMTVC